MHIEKNVFVNILNMVMDVEGGKKDSIKARMNIVLFCDHQNIKLLNDELWVAKSKVTFALYIYKKKHNILFINGLRVYDFLIDMLRT